VERVRRRKNVSGGLKVSAGTQGWGQYLPLRPV
jgi:hypothetical protein